MHTQTIVLVVFFCFPSSVFGKPELPKTDAEVPEAVENMVLLTRIYKHFAAPEHDRGKRPTLA